MALKKIFKYCRIIKIRGIGHSLKAAVRNLSDETGKVLTKMTIGLTVAGHQMRLLVLTYSLNKDI